MESSLEPAIESVKHEIEGMLQNPIEPRYTSYPMKVSGKVIQQISTGIYRSPANAIKELVSNSFDADASFAAVDTGRPNFGSFSIYDDGVGMSASEFIVRMQKIGASEKLPGEFTKKKRPVIGKIGIGLLAVGHISQRFTVVSGRSDDEQGFEAKVDMSRLFQPGAESLPLEELSAGTVQLRMYRKPKQQQYTSIQIEQVSQIFRDLLMVNVKDRYRWSAREGKIYFEDFVDFVQTSGRRISALYGYDQMIWELGLLSPVQYLENGPVSISHEVLSSLKHRLQSYDFRLYVDGTEIRKPILFPGRQEKLQKGKDFGVYPLRIKEESDDGVIDAIGYLYHQNVRILPPEQRGVMPRMKNVGIGLPFQNIFRILTQSPVVAWQVSGELYIDQGLDDALNIDRNSFFEAAPSFQLLRKRLEKVLREEKIVAHIKRRQKERALGTRDAISSSQAKMLERLASKAGVARPRIRFVGETRAIPIKVESSGLILVYKSKLRKNERFLLQGLMLCFELSRKSKKAVDSFYTLVQTFLEEVTRARQ